MKRLRRFFQHYKKEVVLAPLFAAGSHHEPAGPACCRCHH